MKPAVTSSPLRRFLRGLTNTCLLLLLPVQLTLAWITNLESPAELPAFLTARLTAHLAGQGLHLQARHFWVLPDLTLAADDLTLGVDGLSGDLFTAARVELALKPAPLLAGRLAPTQLRLSGARLWCPASVARAGTRRPLLDELTVDIAQEGRWLNLRSLQARSGKITCHLTGEVPAGLLRTEETTAEPVARSRQLATLLGQFETALEIAERSGGASLTLRCQGHSDGSADLTLQAVVGDDWADGGLGLIQARGLHLHGSLKLTARGQADQWSLAGEAREMAWRGLTVERLGLQARGKGWSAERVVHLQLAQAKFAGAEIQRAVLQLQPSATGSHQLGFQLLSPHSTAAGTAWLDAQGATKLTIHHATLTGAELASLPVLAASLPAAGLDLRGNVLLRKVNAQLTPQGDLTQASGEVAAAGLRVLGLSAEAISPRQELPLRTHFTFVRGLDGPSLQLRDLRLASVVGEAECQLRPGGAFRLSLRGELAPKALDLVLGEWWTSLWQLFHLRENPVAFIDVAGQLGSPCCLTQGRVFLKRFDFLGAPFRQVEVSVQADTRQTNIGLHGLQGGESLTDGSVDGSAVWDWSKPAALAGPTVRLAGNLQPWIAARCAGKEFGEALRGLSLPAEHHFSLVVTPGAKGPDIHTALTCAGDFNAWGIAGHALNASTETVQGVMLIRAQLGLAGGLAQLTMTGDPLRQTQFTLGLKGCAPAQIGKLLSELGSPTTTSTPPAGPARGIATLDLDFHGHIELAQPRDLRGLGQFTLNDPELKKVRVLGGISRVLEVVGVGATTYELTQAKGTFGCLGGRAYCPDLAITGPQARLDLTGEVDLRAATLDFEGDFSLPRKAGFNPLEILNLNRALLSLTKIKLKGPISEPETSALPALKDIIKYQKDSKLGKIPDEIQE